jgi:trimethylamine--corrinoid protein Co-methyltransferase
MSNCFVVPPMKFATESCITMEACIRAGMPVLLLSAGQAGATAPAPLASAIVQAVAECLAGVVYVNAMAPGHPAVFGTWPFVSDLRTGRDVGRVGANRRCCRRAAPRCTSSTASPAARRAA